MKARVNLHGLSVRDTYHTSIVGVQNPDYKTVRLRSECDIIPSYPKGKEWGYIEDPEIPVGVVFRLIPDGAGFARPELISEGIVVNNTGGQRMTGLVFEGVVVKTTQVAAGVGLTSSVPKSEIVLVVPPFVAKDAVNAQAVMLSAAKDAGHALDDPTEVLEAKVRQFA